MIRLTQPPMKRLYPAATFLCVLGITYSQQGSPEAQKEAFRKRSIDAEKTGLAEPFRGVTTDGKVQPGLFPIKSTGVSTGPVRKAAQEFLAALSEPQRSKTKFAVDDMEWRKWMNQDFYVRQGVSFDEMSEPQRQKAFGLLKASLSAKGLQLSKDIMRLNYTLGELNSNDFVRYGEWWYWITIMGDPSGNGPWGWQIDGHHLIVNYFVLGDQVVMAPGFFGSEPVIATSGKYKGTSILQEEQRQGLEFLRSLDAAQAKKAIVTEKKPANNAQGEAFKDNLVLEYTGLRGTELTAVQKKKLLSLANLWIGNMDEGHAKVKLSEVEKHMNDTYFSWIGESQDKSVYYFRIHSPVVLIEFDHQRPVGLRHLSANAQLPDHEHIHTVIRTPNGNDYGKDLLRQHLALHPH